MHSVVSTFVAFFSDSEAAGDTKRSICMASTSVQSTKVLLLYGASGRFFYCRRDTPFCHKIYLPAGLQHPPSCKLSSTRTPQLAVAGPIPVCRIDGLLHMRRREVMAKNQQKIPGRVRDRNSGVKVGLNCLCFML